MFRGGKRSVAEWYNQEYRKVARGDVLRPFKFTTAQRCRSETENFILDDLFSSVLSQFKKYHPSGNLKLNNLIIFQNLKLRILMEKNPFNFS